MLPAPAPPSLGRIPWESEARFQKARLASLRAALKQSVCVGATFANAPYLDSSQRSCRLCGSILDFGYAILCAQFYVEMPRSLVSPSCCAPVGHTYHGSGRRACPAERATHCVVDDRQIPAVQTRGEGVLQPLHALRADTVQNDSVAAIRRSAAPDLC